MTTTIDCAGVLDFDSCYRAVSARDSRFDGQFFIAVHTTGIYCRPSCPARTPHRQNVHFVLTAAAAQQQGYRACRRCAPDAVPGSPRWNTHADLSARAMRLIADGALERGGVEELAARLGYTSRHLTRVLTTELGAGPLALARAHRAGTARVLIQRTAMPMADIAFASGFRSVRQFNDTIRDVFGLTPSRMRSLGAPAAAGRPCAIGEVSLRLAYRPPLHLPWLRWFLGAHLVAGLETMWTGSDPYEWRHSRAVDLPHGPALATIEPAPAHVNVRIEHLDMRDLGVAVNRVRRLLDLDADPLSTDEALGADPDLARLVRTAPGLRVPGTMDSAETLIRTMIGQQISVAAARRHVDRLVDELGRPAPWTLRDDSLTGVDLRDARKLAPPGPDDARTLTPQRPDDARTPAPPGPGDARRLFPTPAAIAEHGHTVLAGPRRRIDAIVSTAAVLADNRIDLHPGRGAADLRAELLTLPGIGPWTADYVTMRVTGNPDIMLDHDLVVRRAAADLDLDLQHGHTAWSPWRSYASMHLWRSRLSVSEPILGDQTADTSMLPKDSMRAPSPRSRMTRSIPARPGQPVGTLEGAP
ncbi:Ada metal-binding domain-containing protein [Gordonia tangerina]|uniref:DNA-3-methyladenine glycosylase II n=1 Tax=Gordonia tangerina TaxID=2911060 RepID=A0ABS9DKP9_9ACTN|nr:Ada metal-binding domain-containing protein [Gordonia tangerina]MCF3939807.1 helix-turn-helix domain-containing protein [Gordonia tangerina]